MVAKKLIVNTILFTHDFFRDISLHSCLKGLGIKFSQSYLMAFKACEIFLRFLNISDGDRLKLCNCKSFEFDVSLSKPLLF